MLKKGVKVHYAFCLSVLNPNVNSCTLGVGWMMFYFSTVEDRSTAQWRRKRKSLKSPWAYHELAAEWVFASFCLLNCYEERIENMALLKARSF